MKRLLPYCLLALGALAPTPLLAAGRGVQGIPDQTGVMITKDVGNERWSITLDFERGTVSGNVFRTNGDPAFVWCVITDADENPDVYERMFSMGCFGADRCVSTPCRVDEEWHALGPVSIPGSFFLP